MLVKFVELRSVSPVGTEKTANLANSAGRLWNLHAGSYRGVTWHYESADVVWLCASGFHRSGDPEDIYRKVERLDAEDRLLPTEAEIDRFTHADYVDRLEYLRRSVKRLVRRAVETANIEFRESHTESLITAYHDEITVEATRYGELYIGVAQQAATPGDLMSQVLAVILGENANPEDILWRDSFPHRPANRGELIASIYWS